MKKKLEETVKALSIKANESTSGIEAQQYAQAVLNVSNALIGLRLNPDKD